MASLLRPKLGLSAFSISLLILLSLLESNFNTPVKIRRWGQLTWGDFQGFPPPFDPYEAAIASSVYLEYDSATKSFHAYAGQHNVRSWAKRSRPDQAYELNHEQYHFNITELHARKLNDYIAANPDGSAYLFNLRLGSINLDLRKMQASYDGQSNHSLIVDQQRWWEYEVDSLLQDEPIWVTDKLSGAKAYFPAKPNLLRGSDEGSRYREYSTSRYGMIFRMASFQNELVINESLKAIGKNYLKSQDTCKTWSFDTTGRIKNLFVILRDTARQSSHLRWVYDGNYIYNLKVTYPNNTGDTTGYARIANSFINSFTITNTDSLWIAKFEKSHLPITRAHIERTNETSESPDSYCLQVGKPEGAGFYRGPFFRSDGALFLVYENMVDSSALHRDDILMLGHEVYTYKPSPAQIYFVPASDIPKADYRINFGYIVNDRKVSGCYKFFYQALDIKLPRPASAGIASSP
jgi:hypothetical protein